MQKLKKIQNDHNVSASVDGENDLSNKYKKIIFLLIIFLLISVSFISIYAGKENTDTTSEGLIINEYVTSNYNTWRDENWDSPDWIELYNSSEESIWLGDIYISDDPDNPEKALLPDYTLNPGEYFLVLASGSKKENCRNFNAPFKLGQNDNHITLSRKQNILDILEIEQLPTDISKGRLLNGQWGYFAIPTPLSGNTTESSIDKDISPIYENQGKVIISEYMTSNIYTLYDEYNDTNDWIELHNTSSSYVNLGTMYLSDNINFRTKFKLPDYDMKPDEYLIINLSESTENQNPFTAHFSLGGNDTHIFLTYQSGYDADIIDVYNLPEDVSAGRDWMGNFGYFSTPTPGQKNSDNISPTSDITAQRTSMSGILINEFMPNNKYGILDTYGKSSDWIELYNPTNSDVSLEGFGLSDDDGNLMKWTFPKNTILPANGYMTVFASGIDESINEEYHTNFSLSQKDELVLLTEPNGAIADSMVIDQLPGNVSKGKINNGEVVYFSVPTPGTINNTSPSHKLDLELDIILSNLYINEIAASEENLGRDVQRLVEYIELYNSGNEMLNLKGYSISDNSGNNFPFGDVSINPGKYLLLVTKGFKQNNVQTIIVDNIRINGSGETIILKDSSNNIIDFIKIGYLLGDYSFGRSVNDINKQVFFNKKTPGSANSYSEFTSVCNKPTFSQNGGMVLQETIQLEIHANEGETIKYTLNGDAPTQYSETYTEPLTINANTIVRAIALCEEKLPSPVASSTYIFNKTHDIPVVCVSTNSYGLFSNDYGIYAYGNISTFPSRDANYFWDEERPISFEYYDTDGKLALAFNAGIRIFGGASRVNPQKSFSIHLRDEYGLDELYYPFFDNSNVRTFKNFLLRCGGQDTETKLKDYFVSKSAIEEGNLDGMRGQPVALYINGEYWGIYNLREKINEDYISSHYNLDTDDINIVSFSGSAIHGDNSDWNQLELFCQRNDFSIQENYDKLADWIDVENFTDYVIFQTFFSNTDVANIKFWQDKARTIKWRVLFYDVDYTLRDWDNTNMIERLYEGTFSHRWFSMQIPVFSALFENEGYREYFLERYAYYLNEVFTDEYLGTGIDEIADVMSNEMVYQTDRWPQYGDYDEWLKSVQTFKDIALNRVEVVIEHLKDYMNIDDTRMQELIPWYVP